MEQVLNANTEERKNTGVKVSKPEANFPKPEPAGPAGDIRADSGSGEDEQGPTNMLMEKSDRDEGARMQQPL